MKIRKLHSLIVILVFALLVVFVSLNIQTVDDVFAQTGDSTPTPVPRNPHGDTSECLGCHSNPEMTGQFPNGETISLFFNTETHPNAGHRSHCTACHDAEQTYPHEGTQASSCSGCHWDKATGTDEGDQRYIFQLSYPDQRSITLEINQSCEKCHSEKFTEIADSAHLKLFENGNRFAPVCIDCHDGHEIEADSLSRVSVAKVCSECHLSVYTTYESSVHGAALRDENNPDVPTCGDCHGIHNVSGPHQIGFRADSIVTCGNCHANPEIMDQYGISTDVLDTYLDDFHGRTVNFFRQSDATQITKATCYDCHGIHNIYSPADKNSTAYPSNLQKTCQKCHPDADIRFPDAWLSHYTPEWEKTPVLFAVQKIYEVLIPTIVGSFIIYILLDARRRIADSIQARKKKKV